MGLVNRVMARGSRRSWKHSERAHRRPLLVKRGAFRVAPPPGKLVVLTGRWAVSQRPALPGLERGPGVEPAEDLHQRRDERRPAGLVAGAHAGAVVPLGIVVGDA